MENCCIRTITCEGCGGCCGKVLRGLKYFLCEAPCCIISSFSDCMFLGPTILKELWNASRLRREMKEREQKERISNLGNKMLTSKEHADVEIPSSDNGPVVISFY